MKIIINIIFSVKKTLVKIANICYTINIGRVMFCSDIKNNNLQKGIFYKNACILYRLDRQTDRQTDRHSLTN